MPNRTDNVSFGPGHGHRFLRVLIVIMALVTAGAFAAGLGWPFELLSHFRPHYAVIAIGLFIVTLAIRAWKLAVLAGLVMLAHVAVMWPEWTESAELDAKPAGGLRIFYHNIRSQNLQSDKVLAQISREQPDVVVLLETNERWQEDIEDLKGSFPYWITRPRPDNFGMTVLAKQAFRTKEAFELAGVQVPAMAVEIEHEDSQFLILAVHTIPPARAAGMADRDRQLEELARRVSEATMPVIVVGDLNASPWSPAFKKLLKLTSLQDSRKGFGVHATWPAFMGSFGIPIDHVLLDPRLACIERRIGDAMGSDHRPISVVIGQRRSN